MKGHQRRIAVIEAFRSEALADEACRINELAQAPLEDSGRVVVRLIRDLLAAEDIAHNDLRVAGARSDGNVAQLERPGRHFLLRDERSEEHTSELQSLRH